MICQLKIRHQFQSHVPAVRLFSSSNANSSNATDSTTDNPHTESNAAISNAAEKVLTRYSLPSCSLSYQPQLVLPHWLKSLPTASETLNKLPVEIASYVDGFSFSDFPEYATLSFEEIQRRIERVFEYSKVFQENAEALVNQSLPKKSIGLGVAYPEFMDEPRYEYFAEEKGAKAFADIYDYPHYLMPYSLKKSGSAKQLEHDDWLPNNWRRVLSILLRSLLDQRKIYFNVEFVNTNRVNSQLALSKFSKRFLSINRSNGGLTMTEQEMALILNNVLLYNQTEFYSHVKEKKPLAPEKVLQRGLTLQHPRRFEAFDMLLINQIGIERTESLYAHSLWQRYQSLLQQEPHQKLQPEQPQQSDAIPPFASQPSPVSRALLELEKTMNNVEIKDIAREQTTNSVQFWKML